MTRPARLIAAIGAALLITSSCMSDAGGVSIGGVAASAAAGSGCVAIGMLGRVDFEGEEDDDE